MGGIAIAQQAKLTKITEKHLKDILHLYGIVSARVVVREDLTSEQLAENTEIVKQILQNKLKISSYNFKFRYY